MSTTIAPSTTATAVIATVEALTTEFVAPAPSSAWDKDFKLLSHGVGQWIYQHLQQHLVNRADDEPAGGTRELGNGAGNGQWKEGILDGFKHRSGCEYSSYQCHPFPYLEMLGHDSDAIYQTAGTSTAAPSSDAASTGSLTSSDSSTSSSGVSGGAIAGAVVGSIAGVALIVLAAFFLFRRRRTQQTGSAAQTGHSNPEMGDGYQSVNGHQGHSAYPDNNAYHTADKALPSIPPEGADIVSPTSYHDGAVPPYQSYELPTNHTYEMESPQGTHPQARELDAGYMGNELHNAGTNHAQRV
ncbi:hypothetical protein TruAng_002589 [Truncatella angustata]|nr:hypothetical protein TruAng_002589 [Truncatella angustata]